MSSFNTENSHLDIGAGQNMGATWDPLFNSNYAVCSATVKVPTNPVDLLVISQQEAKKKKSLGSTIGQRMAQPDKYDGRPGGCGYVEVRNHLFCISIYYPPLTDSPLTC